jgi:pimeloyl-ACP methyl ester carboxylesterase
MEYRFERTSDGASFDMTFGERKQDKSERQPLPVRGTILYLHGWGLDGGSMLPWAIALGERGYRGVVVDLRNHGGSGRAPAGYGTREGDDVAALVSHLRNEGLAQDPLHLFGVSYGAVSAIFAASQLQGEVGSVVAIAPYARASEGIRGMIERSMKTRGSNVRSRIYLGYVRRRYDTAAIESEIRQAQTRLDLDFASIDVAVPLSDAIGCTVILHGSEDSFFDPASIRALAGQAERAQFLELAGESHFTAPMRMDILVPAIDDWLSRSHPEACGQFALPESASANGAIQDK